MYFGRQDPGIVSCQVCRTPSERHQQSSTHVPFHAFYSQCPLRSQIDGNSLQLRYRPCKTVLHLYNLAVVWLSMWPCYLDFAQSETGSTGLCRIYLHHCSTQENI